MELDALKIFFMWCSIINVGVLLFSALLLSVFRNKIIPIHKKFSGLEENDLKRRYFNFLGNYKIAIFILNFVPYLVLEFFI
ncbi:MAG: hypothetical protein CMQ51_06135 [Gammaproteobacteria bacterium]|nr:hypothetical protein [Gammaproteobacteria bacterium]|tara:strand:+ start:282 stop:524 length:243 start_codon:yes stop_codon:yes gene_type:complete